MVRAKRSPSRIERRKHGPGIRASPRKEIVFPNIRGAVGSGSGKHLGRMTRITLHVTTRQVERLRALRIFFRENQAFEKTGARRPAIAHLISAGTWLAGIDVQRSRASLISF